MLCGFISFLAFYRVIENLADTDSHGWTRISPCHPVPSFFSPYYKAVPSCFSDNLSGGTCCKSRDIKELKKPQITQILADSAGKAEAERGRSEAQRGPLSSSFGVFWKICGNLRNLRFLWICLRPKAALGSQCPPWFKSSPPTADCADHVIASPARQSADQTSASGARQLQFESGTDN